MKKYNAEQTTGVQGQLAERISAASDVHAAYIGLDVHKDSISVAIAEPGRHEPEFRGEIPNKPKAIDKLVKQLSERFDGQKLLFCYEAGPCGYVVYHQISDSGHDCEVVAPALIPRRPGDRVKTDRRDAKMLSRLSRSGELTPVWVPSPEQEAIRDLTRAREDMKAIELKARQRLNAFLLRHGRVYQGNSRWIPAHFHWLETVRFDSPIQQLVLEEYIDAVKSAQRRVAGLEKQMELALEDWSLAEVSNSLEALRGVRRLTAMTVLAELGDISRFDNPRQLMAYVGIVPSEHSSGDSRRQGGITKTGNGHVRRILVEAAWNYRYPARRTRTIEQRAEKTSPMVQSIAWEAQKRLCGRYRRLAATGRVKQQVTTAVARELLGFIWAIACEVTGKPHGSRVAV